MAIRNTTSMLMLLDATAVANSLDVSFSANGETVNITTKDSGKFEEFFQGALNATASVSGYYEDGSLDALWTAFLAGSEVTCKIGDAESGTEYFTGTAIFSSFEVTGSGYQNAGTFSGSTPSPTRISSLEILSTPGGNSSP